MTAKKAAKSNTPLNTSSMPLNEIEAKVGQLVNRASRMSNAALSDAKTAYSGLGKTVQKAQVVANLALLNGVTAEQIAAAYLHQAVTDYDELRLGLAGAADKDSIETVVGLMEGLDKAQEDIGSCPDAVKQVWFTMILVNLEELQLVLTSRPESRKSKFTKPIKGWTGDYLRQVHAQLSKVKGFDVALEGHIRAALLNLSQVPICLFEGEKEDADGVLGAIGVAQAIVRYRIVCPSCSMAYEFAAGKSGAFEGKELICPSCGHKAVFTLVNEDH